MSRIKGFDWLRIAVYGVLVFFIYRSTLDYLYSRWQEDDFSYCFIIPLIVLYLIWERRKKLDEAPSRPSWKGFFPIGCGILLFVVGELGAEYTTLYLSLWLVTVGLCWLHLGWRKLLIISFPLFFSLAMFPPPVAVNNAFSFKLKLISSQLGVAMMQAWGLSAYREGNVIDLGFTRLQVVDACSGLRFVIPLFIMGVLLASYYRAPAWKRLLLILSTIPLSVFTNSLRIALVGVLYQFFGAAAAEGFFHDFSGWFIFVLSLALLLLEMWGLNKVFPPMETGQREVKMGGTPRPPVPGPEAPHRFFHPRQVPVAFAVLLLTLALGQVVIFREKIPALKSFVDFPLRVGEWRGRRMAMEQEFVASLNLTDYVMIDYRDAEGKEVNLYVAYNSSQTKRKATHSPATCLPGDGWDFRESGPAPLPFTDRHGMSMQVNRAFIEKNGLRQMIYYWFPQRGRILTKLYQVKFYNFWDALTLRRTDGALVRLITPVYSLELPSAAESRLQRFASQIAPVVDGYLPRR